MERLTIVDVDSTFTNGCQDLSALGQATRRTRRDSGEIILQADQIKMESPAEDEFTAVNIMRLDFDDSESESEPEDEPFQDYFGQLSNDTDYFEIAAEDDRGAQTPQQTHVLDEAVKDKKVEQAVLHKKLLYLARCRRFAEANELMSQLSSEHWELAQDSRRRTAAHYAAMSPDGESTVLNILKLMGKDALLKPDYKSVTALHFSFGCQSKRVLENLLSPSNVDFQASLENLLQIATSNKNSIAHYAALNIDNQDLLLLITDSCSDHCKALYSPNANGQTVLHLALRNCSDRTAIKLLESAHRRSRWYCNHLKSKDKLGNTCLHYAAMRKEVVDEVVVRAAELTDGQCLKHQPVSKSWRNANEQSVLHLALQNCKADTFSRVLRQETTRQALASCCGRFVGNDQSENSVLHYAAMNTGPEDVLLLALDDIERKNDEESCFCRHKTAIEIVQQCLNRRNCNSHTVLHTAAQNCSFGALKQLVLKTDSESLRLSDNSGNTCLHYIAMREHCDEALLAAVKESGLSALLRPNKLNQTVLRLAIQNCSNETMEKFSSILSDQYFKARSDSGDTLLHHAVKHKKYAIVDEAVKRLGTECLLWRNNRQKTVLHMLFSDPNYTNLLKQILSRDSVENYISMLDSSGRNGLFYACTAWNVEALELTRNLFSEIRRIDMDGNTLMHALFMNREPVSTADNFIRALKILADAGVDSTAENSIGRTCLQVCQLEQNSLTDMLHQAAQDEDIGKLFKSMLISSDGFHAVHCLSRSYKLQDIVEPLAILLEMEVSSLIGLTVSTGPLRGATCLHFACESGHESNVRFLVKNGLPLTTVTHSGLSCVDFACNAGMEEVTRKVANKVKGGPTKTQFLKMLDPPRRALNLPDRETALKTLASLQLDFSSNQTCVRLLLLAIDQDSPDLLRSMISLDLITPEIEFSAALFIIKDLPRSTEMAIVDAALMKNKFSILPDLILLRQFELIPACLRVLVQLKRKLKQMPEQREKIRELRCKVTCVAGNALDEMFSNASKNEKQLLFDYICGRMQPHEISGPRFTFEIDATRKVQESSKTITMNCTLMRLVLESNCNELLATECLSHLADEEWKNANCCIGYDVMRLDRATKNKMMTVPQYGRQPAVSPKAKFFSYWISMCLWLVVISLLTIVNPVNYVFNWYNPNTNGIFYTWLDICYILAACVLTDGILRMVRRFSLPSSSTNTAFLVFSVVNTVVILFAILDLFPTYYGYRLFVVSITCLWGLHLVSFLSYWSNTGRMVIMITRLLGQDLLPFLAILSMISFFFGIFFFNLLYPVPNIDASWQSWWTAFVQVYTLPLKLLFTEFDRIKYDTTKNMSMIQSGTVAFEGGSAVFNDIFEFIYLLLVNLTMVNVLIALFSLRVSKISSKSKSVWRRLNFDALMDSNCLSAFPPPLSLLYLLAYFVHIFSFPIAFAARRRCSAAARPRKTLNDWWHSEVDYPHEYLQFLHFQAKQLRRCRFSLTRQITAARSDIDGVKAHSDNCFDALRRELNVRTEPLQQPDVGLTQELHRVSEGQENRLKKLERRTKQHRKRANQLEAKVDRIIELLHK